jgi:hypothetical protein
MRYRLRTLLQFRISTLLILVTLSGVWLGIQVNRANRQKRAVAAIQAARGVVHYDYQRDSSGNRIPDAEPPGPKWLRTLIGDDYFCKVVTVTFATEFYGRRKELGLSKVDDDGLVCCESLPDLEVLELGNNRAVTDKGLVHLQNLKKLKVLYLYDCSVIGIGVTHLAALPKLEALELLRSPVTYEGLIAISRLQGLTYLGLAETPIVDDDLSALKSLNNLKELRLWNTAVTDAGLVHLEGLVGLQRLELPTAISDEALKRLQEALPDCQIYRPK